MSKMRLEDLPPKMRKQAERQMGILERAADRVKYYGALKRKTDELFTKFDKACKHVRRADLDAAFERKGFKVQYPAVTPMSRIPGKHTTAQPTECDGHKFRSKAERARWLVLRAMERQGEICGLKHEAILFRLGRDERGRLVTWLPDFTYATTTDFLNWQFVADEVKGRRFRDFGVRMALFKEQFPEWKVVVNGTPVA